MANTVVTNCIFVSSYSGLYGENDHYAELESVSVECRESGKEVIFREG